MSRPSPTSDGPGSTDTAAARLRAADRRGALLVEVPRWAALALVVWQLRLGLEVLSGRTGLASLLERFGRETSLWELVCWAAAAAGLAFGIHSRYVVHRLTAGARRRR